MIDVGIETTRAIPLTAIVEQRGIALKKQGRELVGPCPICGGVDRFAIHVRRGVWNCRRCGGKGAGSISLTMFVDGCDFRQAIETLIGKHAASPRLVATAGPKYVGADDEKKRVRAAGEIWRASTALRGTIAEAYLASRRINLCAMPPELHRVLRWHPRCPWEDCRQGCMVALFTDAITGEPRAIHRTAITPTGEKIDRKALGPTAGCVIRLWPDEAATEGLVLGEGIETTLAAATNLEHAGTLLKPAWAAGFAGNLAAFPVLAGIECLTILVDNDASRGGQSRALDCSNRWTAAGKEVIRLIPWGVGTDFNDLAREGSA